MLSVDSLSLEGALPAQVELEGGRQAGAGLALSVELVSQVVVEFTQSHQRRASSALATHVSLASSVGFREEYQVAGRWGSLSTKVADLV